MYDEANLFLHSLTLLQSNIFLQWMIKPQHHQTIIAVSSEINEMCHYVFPSSSLRLIRSSLAEQFSEFLKTYYQKHLDGFESLSLLTSCCLQCLFFFLLICDVDLLFFFNDAKPQLCNATVTEECVFQEEGPRTLPEHYGQGSRQA